MKRRNFLATMGCLGTTASLQAASSTIGSSTPNKVRGLSLRTQEHLNTYANQVTTNAMDLGIESKQVANAASVQAIVHESKSDQAFRFIYINHTGNYIDLREQKGQLQIRITNSKPTV